MRPVERRRMLTKIYAKERGKKRKRQRNGDTKERERKITELGETLEEEKGIFADSHRTLENAEYDKAGCRR